MQEVYILGSGNENLSITTEHKYGSDPDLIYMYAPDGKLVDRLSITASTTTNVTLGHGAGTYKFLPVSKTYLHTYAAPGTTPVVVKPFDHQPLLRTSGSVSLYFKVPEATSEFTFFANSVQSSTTVTIQVFDPSGLLMHTFNLSSNTYHQESTFTSPVPGFWKCMCKTSTLERCGFWVEGIPNLFSATPDTWFEPDFPTAGAILSADGQSVVSEHARVGVNWWLSPYNPGSYQAERDGVVGAFMDTARLTVDWAWREPSNDNSDPFTINWSGFNFSGHDDRMKAYKRDVVSSIPETMPVLLFYWSYSVSWQNENPVYWTQAQMEEYAEFVLATMIHTVAPDLEIPPGSGPSYPFQWIEILNEPNLTMGSSGYPAYISLVETVGKRLKEYPDPRIQSIKIAAPGIGWAWGKNNVEMENWIGKLIDYADPYVDGINWHQYDYLHIEQCHQYEEDIHKVKQWLRTRGDGIDDEAILMTETNQHGGPPTWWKRQDTFYASRWWVGVLLSALRGGVDFIHFYQLTDDPPLTYNYKGLMFHDGPYQPPLFPGGPPHGWKPVLHATRFINEYRNKWIVSSQCDHPDIAHLITMDPETKTVSVLLANLFDREIDLDISIMLPEEMQYINYTRASEILSDESGRSVRKKGPENVVQASRSLDITLHLDPRTIHALLWKRPPHHRPFDFHTP